MQKTVFLIELDILLRKDIQVSGDLSHEILLIGESCGMCIKSVSRLFRIAFVNDSSFRRSSLIVTWVNHPFFKMVDHMVHGLIP